MPHPLEDEYGLSADELLEAINLRFRAKVTLEGAVAEVQLEKKIAALIPTGIITRYESHDADGKPDFTIWLPDGRELRVECKNVRNSTEAFRRKGEIVAYKVETQKTRASQSDPSSRYYGFDQFEILAVCLGKKIRDWKRFAFVRVDRLEPHSTYPLKMATMQRVPLPENLPVADWFDDLGDLLRNTEANEQESQ